MASDTFLQIAQAVARETDEASISTLAGATADRILNIISWINEGYELAWNRAWKNESTEVISTISVSASTYDFSSSPSIKYFKKLWITGFRPIDIITFERLISEYPNDGSIMAQPYVAAYEAKKIYFYPIPDMTYTVNYSAKASFSKLANNTDVAIIDTNCLKEYGKYKQFSRDGNNNAAQIAYIDFERLLKNFTDSLKQHHKIPSMIKTEEEMYMESVITLDQAWGEAG